MEALFKGSYLLPKPPKTTMMLLRNPGTFNFNHFPNGSLFSSSSSFSGQFSVQNKPRKSFSFIMNARKKEDNHSFVPKPDEITGFFPESVLLKKVVFFYSYPLFFLLFILVYFFGSFNWFCFKFKISF